MSRKREKSYNAKIDLSRLYGDNSDSVQPEIDAATESITQVPLEKIRRTPEQVRRYFDPDKMQNLILSVAEEGILENLVVSPLDNGNFQLISGERRLRAAKESGITKVPVKVLKLTEKDAFRISLIENLQREDLNPVEETDGIIKLVAGELNVEESDVISLLYQMQNEITRGKVNHNVVVQDQFDKISHIFGQLGRLSWQSFVKHRLPLRKLPHEILQALREGKIAYTKAQAIARIKDQEERNELLDIAISEKLSLKEINQRVAQIKRELILPAHSETAVLHERAISCFKALKKSDIWTSPKKQKKLDKILEQLERLL